MNSRFVFGLFAPALLRRVFYQVHLWTGLVAGLVLAVAALSGAALIFRPALEAKLDPQRFVVQSAGPRLSLGELVACARVAHPAAELESVRYFGNPTAPVLVYFSDRYYVHLHPATGAVLGGRARYGEGFGWIEGLHKYLKLEPSLGEPITGGNALVCAGLVLTGIVLWWPATLRALRAGLTINRRLSGRPWYLNLHKTTGAYAALLLCLSALTGASIAFDGLKRGLYPLTHSTKVALPAPSSAGGVFAGFGLMAQRMASVFPAARETYIPRPKKGLVAAYVIAADAPHPNARSYAWLDPVSAQPLQVLPYAAAPRGYRLYYWMLSLHTGLIGGWGTRLLLLLGALLPPVLAWTGTASYLKRKSRAPAAAVTVTRRVETLTKI